MITRGAYANSYDRSIQKEFFAYHAELAPEYSKIAPAWTATSGKDYTISELAGLSTLRLKAEGSSMSMDNPYAGHKMTIPFYAYALASQITHEAKADAIHGGLEGALKRLARNANKTIDVLFMQFMANTFGTSLAWDGNAVCYDTHTTLRGGTTLDNLGTAALSPTSFQAALDYYVNVVGGDDLPVGVEPGKLLYARKNSQIVWELQTSIGRVVEYTNRDKGYVNNGTSEIAPNVGQDRNRFNPSNDYMNAWEAIENHFYVAAGATVDDWWLFAKDSERSGIQMIWRDNISVESYMDKLTKSEIVTAYMRLNFALPDYTKVYGSNV